MHQLRLQSIAFSVCVASSIGQQKGSEESIADFVVGGVIVRVDGSAARVSRDQGRTFHALPATDERLFLRSGSFDPLQAPILWPAALQAPAGTSLHCVQARTAILPEYRRALETAGLAIVGYWPKNAYLVRGERAPIAALAAEPWVRATFPLAVGDKLDPTLHARATGLAGPQPLGEYNVVLARQADRAQLAQQIAALGGRVVNPHEGSLYVIASLTARQLAAVAALDTVVWIDETSGIELDMDNARIQGGGNYVESIAGYRGQGVRAEISEGFDQTHPDWTNPPLVRFDSNESHGHCTAGIVGGNGSGNAAARGMMPDAQLIESSFSGFAGASRFTIVQGSVDPAGPWRCMQQTASWGNTLTTQYTSISADMDNALFTFDFVLTQSQSNAGASAIPQNSRPQAWAKNVISVGGLRHQNNSNPSDEVWTGASIGPAADGRIKPEICAYYDQVLCSDLPGTAGYSTTNYYSSFSGTSSATPIVSGHVGLIQQMFTDGLFHNPLPLPATAANRFENKARFTTTKSLLVNTASSYAFSGTTANLTRTRQGWGFPDLRRLYDNRDKIVVIDEYTALQQGQTRSYYVWVRPGTAEFRATMAYADPPAIPSAAITRVNSVDLGVRQLVGGTHWWGNNGLDVGNVSASGGLPNDVDTTEQVWIATPAPGIYEVSVSAPTIVQDAKVETPEIDVDYALVMHPMGGGFHAPSPLQLSLTSDAPGNLAASMSGVPGGWAEGYTFFSLATQGPKGFGNLLGVERDFLVDASLNEQAAPGNPLHFVNVGPGSYPFTQFSFPSPLAQVFAGLTVDAVVMLLDANGSVVEVSNVARVTIQ